MTQPAEAKDWRRTWVDGHSRLTVEHDPGGRVFFAIDDLEAVGFAASFDPETKAEIAAFIKGES